VELRDGDVAAKPLTGGVSTRDWYRRHQRRNSLLKDVFDQSRYMVEASTSTTAAAMTLGTGTALGLGAWAAGIAGGAGFVVLLGAKGRSAIGTFVGGLMIAATGIVAGTRTMAVGSERAQELIDDGVGQAGYYRYVRFLPDQVFLEPLAQASPPQVRRDRAKGRSLPPFFAPPPVAGAPRVFAFHVPSPAPVSPPSRSRTSVRYWPIEGKPRWAYDATPMTRDEAVAACEHLPAEMTGPWRLVRHDEVAAAVTSGIETPSPENLIAPDLSGRRVWTSNQGRALPDLVPLSPWRCQIGDLQETSEKILGDCGQKLPALCVSYGETPALDAAVAR
jgi:hypothetical protein